MGGLDPEVRDLIAAALKQAQAQPPGGQAAGRLGMILQAHSLFPAATLAYRRAIRLEPREFAWPYYLALVLQQQSKTQEALDSVTAALRIRPDYTPAILKRSELLLKLGRLEESSAGVEMLLAEFPHTAAPLYALARVRQAQQNFSAAEDLYRQASQAYPTFGAAYYGLARTGRRLGHDAESARNFELAERYRGDSPQADDPLLNQVLSLARGVHTHLLQAHDLLQQGNLDEAWRLYRDILKQYPDNLESLLNLLYLAHFPNHGTPEEVETFYKQALRIDPGIPQIYANYGNAMAGWGKLDAAAAAIKKAIELKPDYLDAHLWLGTVRERQNRPAEAVTQYRQALVALPGYRAAQLALGRLLLNLGQNREAIAQLLPTLNVDDPDTTIAMVFVAQAYANSGDLDKAGQYLRQARARAAKTGPPELLQQLEGALQRLGSRL